MARITLEAVTKDVKHSKTGELVYVEGQTRIRVFEDDRTDGMTLEAFEALVSQANNWIMVNTAFEIGTGLERREIPSREMQYSPDKEQGGIIKVRRSDGTSTMYNVQDSVIQAFAVVAAQTRINNREIELRKQNGKKAA